MKMIAAVLLLSFVAAGSLAAETAPAERLSGALLLISSGKQAQARPLIEQALADYRAASNGAGEGVCLVLLGMADLAEQNTDEARCHLDAGASRLRRSGDFMSAFMALQMLAELDTAEGRIEASLSRHQEALDAIHAASAPGTPFTIDGLKILGPAVGLDLSSLGPLLISPEIVKPFLLLMAEVIVRDGFGHILTDAGLLDEADEQLQRALAAAAMFGGLFDTSIEAHIGNLRRRQWRFDEAREHYQAALRSMKPMPMLPMHDEWLQVRMLVDLAEIELLSGRIDQALAWNDQALAVVRASGNKKQEAYLVENRGDLLLRGGRFGQAEKSFLDAIALGEASGDIPRQASAGSSLGSLYQQRGDLGKAAAALERSVALYQKTNWHEAEAATWVLLSTVYLELNADDALRSSLDHARATAKKSGFPAAGGLAEVLAAVSGLMSGKGSSREVDRLFGNWWELPETRDLMIPEEVRAAVREVIGLESSAPAPTPAQRLRGMRMPNIEGMRNLLEGKRLAEQGDSAGARSFWMKALEANSSKDLRACYLAAIGATYWKEGKEDEAIRYFDQAVQGLSLAVEDVKVEELLAGYLGSNRRWFFDIGIQMLVRRGRYEDAFDYSERARARAFLQSIGNARLRPARGAAADLVNEAESLRKSIAAWEEQGAFRSEDVAADLRNARERYQSLLTRLKVSNPEYASLTSVEPVRLADLQRELPAETTLITFFIEPSAVLAWVIDRQSFKFVPLPATPAQVERVVCWAKQLDGSGGAWRSMSPQSGQCSDTATAEEAYALLFAPLRSAVRHSRLILVPHRALHYVPFAALRDPKSGHALLEDYTITYSPSASALRFLRERETPVDGGALVIGNPAATGQSRLSGAQREATAIATAFGTAPKLGGEATESLLYGLRGRYDVVHIGAHAAYDAEHPLFSRIALAKDERADGNLNVHEILGEIDLSGVNLVVLSACGTARGARSEGDEIVGLTRAVLYAGTPGVISTLWDIDDQAAADLMQDFYGRLLRGMPAAEALRAAQLTMMKRAPYAHPRFWAAFELYGTPRGRWPADVSARGGRRPGR